MKKTLVWIVILSAVGMLVSGYLTYLHFKPSDGTGFCVINEYFNCDIVNKSTYAEVAGVPVAMAGLAAYIFFFIAAVGLLLNWFPRHEAVKKIMAVFSGLGLGFSLYLTFIELFVLHAVCIFCLTSQVIILLIFILSIFLCRKRLPSVS